MGSSENIYDMQIWETVYTWYPFNRFTLKKLLKD